MDWFPGSSSDAVRSVREQSKKLLVFVQGDDKASKFVDDQFTSDIAVICNAFVCLRLDSSSDAAAQFSAVYPAQTVPCLYLIAPTGELIDTKPGYITKDDILGWLSKHSQQSADLTHGFGHQLSSETEATSSGSPLISSLQPATLEDRTQRARRLVEEKRHERLAEEKINARDEEVNRRAFGKAMHNFKERQRAREVDEMMLERRKDEVENQRLRECLRQQIEDDRRAKQERTNLSGSLDSSPQKVFKVDAPIACTGPSALGNDKARLQIRLVDGGHFVGCFPATATLAGEVRNWLQNLSQSNPDGTAELPYVDDSLRRKLTAVVTHGYRFRQLHPARLFDPEDETKTVADLELCPSAVLMLVSSASRYTPSVQGTAGSLVSWLYSIVNTGIHSVHSYATWVLYSVWSIGSSFLATTRPNSIDSSRVASIQPSSSSSGASAVSKSGLPVKNRSVRRQGNMARLSHLPDDSDDEQARWNGNSTAQL